MVGSVPNLSTLFRVSFFDFQKVQFQAVGVLLAAAANILLAWLTGLAGAATVTGIILNVLEGMIPAIILLLSGAGVARMIKADLLKEAPVSTKDAMDFLKKNLLAIICSPFVLILFIALILGLEALISVIGFIPIIGPLALAVLTIPAVIVNVVLVIIILVGSKLLPAIIAVEETRTIDTIRITYQVCKDEPLKVAFYAGMLSLIGIGIFLLPFLVFFLGLAFTCTLNWSVLYPLAMSLQCDPVQYLFLMIAGVSALIMGSLVLALPLTYFQGVYTYLYLSFKDRLVIA